jgi:hypothetical protein
VTIRAKQANDIFVVEHAHIDPTDNVRPNLLTLMRGSALAAP